MSIESIPKPPREPEGSGDDRLPVLCFDEGWVRRLLGTFGEVADYSWGEGLSSLLMGLQSTSEGQRVWSATLEEVQHQLEADDSEAKREGKGGDKRPRPIVSFVRYVINQTIDNACRASSYNVVVGDPKTGELLGGSVSDSLRSNLSPRDYAFLVGSWLLMVRLLLDLAKKRDESIKGLSPKILESLTGGMEDMSSSLG